MVLEPIHCPGFAAGSGTATHTHINKPHPMRGVMHVGVAQALDLVACVIASRIADKA